MKLDTSEPKDWKKFIAELEPDQISRFILSHCRIDSWNFPTIVLSIENYSREKPLSPDILQTIEKLFSNRYEGKKIHVHIFPRIEGKRFYSYEEFMHRELVKTVSKYVTLSKNKGGYCGLCPFHTELTPSFVIKDNEDVYRCLSCSATGNHEDFIKAINKGDHPDHIYIDECILLVKKLLCNFEHIHHSEIADAINGKKGVSKRKELMIKRSMEEVIRTMHKLNEMLAINESSD